MKLLRPLTYIVAILFGAALPFTAIVLAAPEHGAGVTMSLFTEVMQTVKVNYVEPVTDRKLIEGAIKGMLASLDPHSNYMDAAEFREMRVQTSGEFGGLGMQVTMENSAVKVISPIDDTPAAKAGIRPNDLIIAIDNDPVSEMTLSEAVDRLRGAIGTQVKVMIKRAQQDPFEIKLTRADIKVDPVKSQLEGKDVAYLRITSFTERTSTALREAYQALQQKSGNKLVGVVLDLRNNPGGLLDEAVGVANEFLDKGEIVSIRGRRSQDNHVFDAQPDQDLIKDLPVVVMINGGSASASEIVAGALQDHHRALLLGTRSFGKGSVQTVLPVQESGGAIRLTTARYYTPSGRSIQAEGIKPDVVVEPAKIEALPELEIRHEADLKNALKNPEAASRSVTTTPAPAKPATPPPATSQAKPAATPAAAAETEMAMFGTANDYQLVRAVDLVRGVAMFKKMAVQ
ncbi:MAG TPA: S41 family peptidase [Stellaceae bacterium]|nr:S41 family peptidase [Stellaceae bacterium]